MSILQSMQNTLNNISNNLESMTQGTFVGKLFISTGAVLTAYFTPILGLLLTCFSTTIVDMLYGFKLAHKSSDLTFNASKVGKNVGVKDLLENKISFSQPLSPPYMKIVENIIKKTIQLSQGRGMGY